MQLKNRLSSRWCRSVLAAGVLIAASMAVQAGPWFDGDRPSAQARMALDLLDGVASHGLEPHDYRAEMLRLAIDRAAPPGADEVARLEQALSRAMERYLSDLHRGRVDPRTIHHDFSPPERPAFDAAAYLQAALATGRLAQAAQEAAPRLPQYEHLRAALAHYRAQAGNPVWRQPLPAPPGGKVAPGQA